MSALGKLGSSLTNAIRKLLQSPVVDEAAVKELNLSIQRALLQADVNVQLVLDLSKEIEKKALEEKLPPGISRREHVVEVTYEVLTQFLGEKPATIRVEAGKPNVFMLVGIQGSGKCVEGDAVVSLGNGQRKRIAALFEEQIGCCDTAVILGDGLTIRPKDVRVHSVNLETLQMEEKPVEWIWKLKAPEELYEVLLDEEKGLKLITTPEHPFFTIEKAGIARVRADQLKKDQCIMITPTDYPSKGKTHAAATSMKEVPIDAVAEAHPKLHTVSDSSLLLLEEPRMEARTVDEKTASKIATNLRGVDVTWAKVRRTGRITEHSLKYVYDLTVQDHHNFVANNIVVKNTTSAAKLARYFQKRGFKTALVCADTFRLGAFDQLKQLADAMKLPIYGRPGEKNSLRIAAEGVEGFRQEGFEVILLDTAGRHKDELNLIKEMGEIAQAVTPDEVILVIDATIGQQAYVQAKAFHEATKIGSILLAKLDGSARGGGALSAAAATGVPIKFIGVGEGVEEIEPFDPSRFVGRLLGMGDIEGLVQRVREAEVIVPEKKAKDILKGKFTLMDMYEQLEAMSGMGPLKRVLQMIPGVSHRVPEEAVEVAEDRIKKWKYILQSMTREEREEPKILNSSRIRRVARGSGTSDKEVKELIKQHSTMRRLMRSMGKRKVPPFLRKMMGQMK
ncbi:MAG: signal recognition particle receptor subunit alpha [Candidatus Bathyarchaeota archaeon]|nr:signal recognition particle receptor subunit alpha [Candidatus Bathyarchaeota archaeon]